MVAISPSIRAKWGLQHPVDVRELLVDAIVVVRNPALLVHEAELVLDGKGHLGHGMGFELGQGEIEIIIALFDEPFEHEARDIDEFLNTLQEDRERPGFRQDRQERRLFPCRPEDTRWPEKPAG